MTGGIVNGFYQLTIFSKSPVKVTWTIFLINYGFPKSLLNKVSRVSKFPKCFSVQVPSIARAPKCLNAQVPKCLSVEVSFEYPSRALWVIKVVIISGNRLLNVSIEFFKYFSECIFFRTLMVDFFVRYKLRNLYQVYEETAFDIFEFMWYKVTELQSLSDVFSVKGYFRWLFTTD